MHRVRPDHEPGFFEAKFTLSASALLVDDVDERFFTLKNDISGL